jgi:hypothetical protein
MAKQLQDTKIPLFINGKFDDQWHVKVREFVDQHVFEEGHTLVGTMIAPTGETQLPSCIVSYIVEVPSAPKPGAQDAIQMVPEELDGKVAAAKADVNDVGPAVNDFLPGIQPPGGGEL